MATLLKKVASRIKGSKSHPDVSCYRGKYRTANKLNPLIGRSKYTCQEPPINEEEIPNHTTDRQDEKHLSQSKLKLWTRKLRKAVRTNTVPSCQWDQPISELPLEKVKSTRLLSSNSPSCTTRSCSMSPPPEVVIDSTVQRSLSETTADIESEFGFTIQRIRCESTHQPPRLYLDMAHERNTFSPFRPFSPGVLTNGGCDQPIGTTAPLRCFSTTSSLGGFRYASDTRTPSFGNRFYSKENLDSLGVNRAVTVDSRLSTASRNPFAPCGGRHTPSVMSSNTNRSPSGAVFSLSIVSSRENSVKSTSTSRKTTPTFSLASPASFC